MIKKTIAITLFVIAGISLDLPKTDYQCTLERVISKEKSPISEIRIGDHFFIEKSTGMMTGALTPPLGYVAHIIDYGSTESSYKAVMRKAKEDSVDSNLYTLTVNEHEGSQKMQFVFQKYHRAYTGWCEHI